MILKHIFILREVEKKVKIYFIKIKYLVNFIFLKKTGLNFLLESLVIIKIKNISEILFTILLFIEIITLQNSSKEHCPHLK
jgi:hypothetical protein